MFNIEYMREKVLRMIDPNDPYTEEDFNSEFSQKNLTNENPFNINVNFKNESTNPDPEYATVGSSGFDLRANLDAPVRIGPHSVKIIPTGLYFEIPENFEIQVRPRSGLAAKNGVTVLNSPGTVDADYRGEVGVILVNLSNETVTIEDGERVAQLVFCKVEQVQLNEVAELNESTRGAGGFGSTGVK